MSPFSQKSIDHVFDYGCGKQQHYGCKTLEWNTRLEMLTGRGHTWDHPEQTSTRLAGGAVGLFLQLVSYRGSCVESRELISTQPLTYQ